MERLNIDGKEYAVVEMKAYDGLVDSAIRLGAIESSQTIKVGDRVHESASVAAPRVRVNGALTIKVKYVSSEYAVVSLADRPEVGRFYAEKGMSRKEFDKTYSPCHCPPSDNCKVD